MPKQDRLSRRQKLTKEASSDSFKINPYASSSSEEITDDEEEVIFSLDEAAMAQLPRQLQHVMRGMQADRHRQFERRVSVAQIPVDYQEAEHSQAKPSDGDTLTSEAPQQTRFHDSQNDHARTRRHDQGPEPPQYEQSSGDVLATEARQHGGPGGFSTKKRASQGHVQEPGPPQYDLLTGNVLAADASQHVGFGGFSQNNRAQAQGHFQKPEPPHYESSGGNVLAMAASQHGAQHGGIGDSSQNNHAHTQDYFQKPKTPQYEPSSGNIMAREAPSHGNPPVSQKDHAQTQTHCQDPEHTQTERAGGNAPTKEIRQHASFRDLSSAERQRIAPWTATDDDPFVDRAKSNRPSAKTGDSSGSSSSRAMYSGSDSTSTKHRVVPTLACASSPHLYRMGRLNETPPLPATKWLSRRLEKYFEPDDRTGPNVRLFSPAQTSNRLNDGQGRNSEARDRQSQGQWLGRFSPMPSSRGLSKGSQRYADTHGQNGQSRFHREVSNMFTSIRSRVQNKMERVSRIFNK